MKKTFAFTVVFLCLLFCFAKPSREVNTEILTVYAYDSFCGEWGPGEKLAREFEEQTGIKVRLVSLDSAVDVYSKFVFEGQACPADVLIGISDTMNTDSGLFEIWTPSCKDTLIDYDPSTGLIPFDYGTFAFIIDSYSNGAPVPLCLEDLTKEIYRHKIIIADPRTSSVGLGLLSWTISAMGEEKAFRWWKDIRPNLLTTASSWSSAYGMFTEHEAPLVISYSTSPVYHLIYENSDRFKALPFLDGHINTVEYLCIPKSAPHPENARRFCNFLLTQGQKDIALANTMFPANSATGLPDEFLSIPEMEIIPNASDRSKTDYYLDRWTEIMTEK